MDSQAFHGRIHSQSIRWTVAENGPCHFQDRPTPQLADWMHQRGWQPFVPPTRHDMLATQSWRRGDVIATDVHTENAILAESDGQIYPFDFILRQTAL